MYSGGYRISARELCGGQRSVAENLLATGKDQSERRSENLEERQEETLKVHRLGVGAALRRTGPTNPIESCLSIVERVLLQLAETQN